MTGTTGLERLAAALEPVEAECLAAMLHADYPVELVADGLRGDRRREVAPLLAASFDELGGDVGRMASVLVAFATAGRRARDELSIVWSGAAAPSSSGRTTTSVGDELLDAARSYVYATTFSGDGRSPLVAALARAVRRQIDVTVVVDTLGRTNVLNKIGPTLEGARFWTMPRRDDRKYRIVHAKIVLVDDRAALISSANLSAAAAERNLECGVVIHDAEKVIAIRRHFDGLHESGHLIDAKPIGHPAAP